MRQERRTQAQGPTFQIYWKQVPKKLTMSEKTPVPEVSGAAPPEAAKGFRERVKKLASAAWEHKGKITAGAAAVVLTLGGAVKDASAESDASERITTPPPKPGSAEAGKPIEKATAPTAPIPKDVKTTTILADAKVSAIPGPQKGKEREGGGDRDEAPPSLDDAASEPPELSAKYREASKKMEFIPGKYMGQRLKMGDYNKVHAKITKHWEVEITPNPDGSHLVTLYIRDSEQDPFEIQHLTKINIVDRWNRAVEFEFGREMAGVGGHGNYIRFKALELALVIKEDELILMLKAQDNHPHDNMDVEEGWHAYGALVPKEGKIQLSKK